MNEFTCVVCGCSVSKRQSLAHGEGRACRSHSEVVAATADRLEAESRAAREKLERAAAQRDAWRQPPRRNLVPLGPTCWCCHAACMSPYHFWKRMMVANEKVHLVGGNIFDQEAMQKAFGGRVSVAVPLNVPSGHPLVLASPDGMTLHAISGGVFASCRDCASRHGLEKEWDAAMSPAITPEQMESMMAITGLLPLFDEVKVEARAEINAEAGMVTAVGEERIQE